MDNKENNYEEIINQMQDQIEKLNAVIDELDQKLAQACSQMENIKNDV